MIQQNLYTAFEWIWRSNQQNLIFFWRVLREKMKIKVSSVKISSKMEHRKYDKFNYVPKKRNYTITRFHEHFTTGNWLVLFNYHIIHLQFIIQFDFERWQSQLAARESHNRNNYYIRPHLDASWFFLYRGSSTTMDAVKINFIYPCFFRK